MGGAPASALAAGRLVEAVPAHGRDARRERCGARPAGRRPGRWQPRGAVPALAGESARHDGPMARPARFTADGILDAAAVVAAQRWREATVADVAARLGAPPGSVYYRFANKDALFGALWLRAVRRFHVGLLEALALPDPGAAACEAAAHVPRFCRDNRLDAIAMTLYRRQDLVARVDGELRRDVEHVNDAVREATAALARARFGRADPDALALVVVACQEGPYGLVRRYLRTDVDMPAWLEDAMRASCRAILALGDGRGPGARG